MPRLTWMLALFLLVFWAGEGRAQEYDFDVPGTERKSFELGGWVEFRYLQHYFDSASSRYKLSYYDDDPGDYTQEGKVATEIKAGYRRGVLQANLLTHHELIKTDPDEEWNNEVYEAYLSLAPAAPLTLEAGKKTTLWGKGYAFNPAGFVNPPKDPDDPELNLEGRTILSADFIKSFTSGSLSNLGLTALLLPVIDDWANAELGGDGDINYALKLYLLWRNTDLDFIYFGGTNQPDSYGFDFAKNLSPNFEVHGELAFLRDVRRTVLNEYGRVSSSRDDQLSYLLGLRYLNAYETTFIAEYYHNGAGYNRSEVEDFFSYQEKAYRQWQAIGNSAVMQRANLLTRPYYRQRNFGQDYFYLKITQKEPLDILYLNPWLAVLANLQDFSYNLQLGVSYAPVTNLELNLRVGIPLGPSGTEFGEKQDSFQPEFWVRYYF
ncbi:MAG: hypothetical protein AB1896_01115 [Thermodesulfobacteriota bacterium]